MLTTIHTAITRLLHDRGAIPPEVAVSFEMPTREWVDSLVIPTLNLFLFDIQENTDLRQTGMQTLYGGDGMAVQRMPPRRFDLCYMVSAVSSVAEDEHTLLWQSLAVLLKHSPFPLDMMPGDLLSSMHRCSPFQPAIFKEEFAARLAGPDPLPAEQLDIPLEEVLADEPQPPDVRLKIRERRKAQEPWTLREYLEECALPLATEVGRAIDGPRALDIWGGLEIPPRPALFYTVTAPVDLEIVSRRPMVMGGKPRVTLVPTDVAIGGVVSDRQGAPLARVQVQAEGVGGETITDGLGQFRLTHLRPGPITLRLTRPGRNPQLIDITIPSDTYDMTLD